MATNLLDAGSVSVPFESLKRVTRERKQVLGYMIEEAEGVSKGVAAAARDASLAQDASAAHAHLDQLVSQLQGLKRKLEATSLSEREDLARCRARLQHLRDLGAPDKDAQARALLG
ncbi:hypothetical protein COHA_001691 [Chlorella ohadii]|uniref:Uncharacterized protein n=1 Tax=Chlorella ohadii TaxID=2649997 RepID=A0AAD5DXH2_9CHLO|nr:hypothetical protein COHA_001691 [Chlorella ohadii]